MTFAQINHLVLEILNHGNVNSPYLTPIVNLCGWQRYSSTSPFGAWALGGVFNHPTHLRELIADLVGSLEILGFAGGLPFFDQCRHVG